jgi:hypothetical protein
MVRPRYAMLGEHWEFGLCGMLKLDAEMFKIVDKCCCQRRDQRRSQQPFLMRLTLAWPSLGNDCHMAEKQLSDIEGLKERWILLV